MAQALKRCPHAEVVPPRFERYTEVSAAIMDVFCDFSPRVEPLSLDEAFIDMTGAQHIFGPPQDMGHAIKSAIFEATGGLTISVGIAETKHVAKVASAANKPNGLTVIAPGTARAWLAPQPVNRLWGVGPKTETRLRALGYHMIDDIACADPDQLSEDLGQSGRHLWDLSRARDPRHVETRRTARSMGSERTLSVDVSDPIQIRHYLQRSADRLARRLRSKGRSAGGVRVRLKTTDFQLLSRQCVLPAPTDTAADLHRYACSILDRFDHPGPYRLVGMAVFDLHEANQPVQMGLLANERKRALEVVLDSVCEKFGTTSLQRARDLDSGTVQATTPDLDFIDNAPDTDG
tara:strand:- start:2316 stop:3359 length:1044 start_codon:yes stop_codon:yes gene_type:complete